jgi:hypothetical protein
MKKYLLREGIVLFLILACFAGFSGCKESRPGFTEITETDVLAIMHEVQKATLAKDLDGVIKHLAPFVVINVTMPTDDVPLMPQRAQMTRDQYAAELKNVFANLTYHEYRRENDKITIREDRRSAQTETDVIEAIIIGGQEIRTTTHQTSVLEIIEGKILVTSIDAVIMKRE